MLIPPSYLFTNPYLADRPERRRGDLTEWSALGADWSARRFGINPAVVSVAGIIAGIVGYGGLMELIL